MINRTIDFFEGSLREKCLNTELFLVRIQSEYRKIRTKITPYLDTFHAVVKQESCLQLARNKSFTLTDKSSIYKSSFMEWNVMRNLVIW